MSPSKRIGGPWIGARLLIGSPAGGVPIDLGGLLAGRHGDRRRRHVTNMAMEERGFVTSARDKAIWTDISARMLDRDQKLFQNVDVQVHEGRVLLSGFVQKPEDRIEATRLAWEPDGVREVVDEIKLGRSLDAGDFSEDVLLIQQIRLKLMFDRDIRAINYSVDCIRSTVYLMASPGPRRNCNASSTIVRDVPYVRAVVNHVRVRTDPLPPIPANPPTFAASNTVPTPPSRVVKPSQKATR